MLHGFGKPKGECVESVMYIQTVACMASFRGYTDMHVGES